MFIKPPDQDGEGWEFGRYRSRVRGAPEVFGQFPIGCLAEEIETPGDGQIRALITVAGNPVVSAPGTPARRALTEARRAHRGRQLAQRDHPARHVILPGMSPLEHPHLDDLYWIYAIASCVKWSERVFEPDLGGPAEWEMLLRLAAHCSASRCRTWTLPPWTTSTGAGLVATVGVPAMR